VTDVIGGELVFDSLWCEGQLRNGHLAGIVDQDVEVRD